MLQAAVDAFSAPGGPGGCLLILGATNCAVENKAVQDQLLPIRRQIAQSILEPVVALTAYYSTVLHGLALQSRDGASRKMLTQVVQLAIAGWERMTSPGAD